MLNGKVLVLTVLLSVVYNSASAYPECSVTTGFDIEKLEGQWHFIGAISPKKEEAECGYISLERGFENQFTGGRVSMKNGHLVMLPITVDVDGDKFILQVQIECETTLVFNMTMKTCDGETEFAVDDPTQNLYIIFGQNKRVSPALLRHYRYLGHSIGLPLQQPKYTTCG